MVSLKYNPPAGFFLEETRNGYTISAHMKQVWAVQLDLLQELLRVCDEHGLKIFADSGTLIGAVRDKGFIPWDDDIDMCMLREDYDRLMQLSDAFQAPYFLQSIYTDSHYNHRHAQLRRTDTLALPAHFKGKPRYNMGIFVDIFVLDRMPNTPRALKHHYAAVASAKLKLKIVTKLTKRFPECLYRWCRNHTHLLSDRYWFEQYEQLMRSVPENKKSLLGCLMCLRMNVPLKRLASYKEVVMLPFEHIQMPCPAGYDEVLRVEYGDYMTPVKAPTHHGSMRFNVDNTQTL
ncbi:MAG: LicD family protein [Bacteroidales bacterium]|nr:LicD family protein [Bacteroidales bacterium]